MEPEGSLPHSLALASCPILNHSNPFHASTFHVFNIHFNIIIVSTARPSKWFLSITSLPQNPIYPSPLPLYATCPTHLILLEFITPIRYGKKHSSTSCSLCSLLYSSVTSSNLGPDIFLSTLSLCSFLNLRPSFTPI